MGIRVRGLELTVQVSIPGAPAPIWKQNVLLVRILISNEETPTERGYDVGAFMIRLGFRHIVYYNYSEEPPNE